ncbi:MAG: hypothetical protein ACOC1L_07165 [Bacillota bacterium]
MNGFQTGRLLIILGSIAFIFAAILAFVFPDLGLVTLIRLVVFPLLLIGMILLYQKDATTLTDKELKQRKWYTYLALVNIIIVVALFFIVFIIFFPGLFA